MAYGNELHFGYPNAKSAWAFLDRVGLKLSDTSSKPFRPINSYTDFMNMDEDPFFDFEIPKSMDDKLNLEWEGACRDAGWIVIDKTKIKNLGPYDADYTFLNTPYGVRKTGPWGLFLNYDPGEMGHTLADMALGVNLSSRYYPCFTDMSSEHGAVEIHFDKDTLKLIEIAKARILKAVPEMTDAILYVRECHY